MKLFALAVVAMLAGCNPAINEPVAPAATVPPNGAAVCAQHCATMGLELSAVVVISNQFGCVCAPGAAGAPGAAISSTRSVTAGASAAASGAIIAAQMAAQAAAAQRSHAAQQARTK